MINHATRYLKFCTAILILISPVVASAEKAPQTTWQILLAYDSHSVTVIEAIPIPLMQKKVRTPGLIGAPIRIVYQLQWLDSDGRTLKTTVARVPLGIRATLTEGEACREIMPPSGRIIIRVEGPDEKQAPAKVHLERVTLEGRAKGRLPLPAPFESDQLELPLSTASRSAAFLAGPVGWEQIHATGNDRNRLVIMVLGDGYTATDLANGDFAADVNDMVADFNQKAPWDLLFSATNIYRIDIESNESGADLETPGVYRDTYLNSSFWTSNIERALAIDGVGYNRAYAAANSVVGVGVWDLLVVLVNSTKYGGTGGAIAVSSVHASASEIVLHEIGHTYARLADEYESAYPGFPVGDGEPNVDFDFGGPGLKWIEWVEPGTPLPTPENSSYGNVVGTFEGARYRSTGIYRPWYNCLMRTLGPEFGPICKESHLTMFMNMMNLTDNVSPAPGTPHEIGILGTTFTLSPLPVDGLVYKWWLDGVPIAGADQPELTLMPGQLSGPGQTLEAEVTFVTDLIRTDSVYESYSWSVSPAPSCCLGYRGNVDCQGIIDIGDVAELIKHLFIDLQPVCCPEEANVDGTGLTDIGDLTVLISSLFISLTPTPACP